MNATEGTCPFKVEELPVPTDRLGAWEQMRAHGPVFEAGGYWYVTSSEACRFVTRNPEIFSSASHGDTLNAPTPYIPGGIDPPEHLRYRQVIDRRFAPRVLAGMDDDLRGRLNELIDRFADTGRCDIMTDLANVFPVEIFMNLFGLPAEDREQLALWVHQTLFGGYEGDGSSAVEAKDKLYDYLDRLIADKRANPGDDVLSYIIEQGWSDAEVMGAAFNLTQGGLDTMTSAVGMIFWHLAIDPELRRRVVENPDDIDLVVEEILRVDAPVPITNRHTTREVELEGVTIPAGAHVRVCYGAASSDPSVFEHPSEIDLEQQNRRDIYTFGGGTHKCPGSHLARRELRLILEEFHRRIPEYSLAADASPVASWPSVVVTLDTVPLVFPVGRER